MAVVAAGCGRSSPREAAALRDVWGRSLAATPVARRIVSLAPATTELVFALGLGARLVGRTRWCDWPPAARDVPDLGAGLEPNVEAVLAQRPDLVLIYPSEANRAAVAQLEGLGVRVAVVGQDAVAEWRASARLVARLAGVPGAAESLLADFDRRLEAARAAPRSDAPFVFIAVGENPPIAIGAGSFVSELVELAGARNAFGDVRAPSAPVSLEAVVARDPDLVVVLGPEDAARRLRQRPLWQAIPAVRERRVIALDGGAFNRPSPRLPEAVRALRARLPAPVRAATP
jgi:ABC-type Fe3+-hydroxamate transport system substrate-binding protein